MEFDAAASKLRSDHANLRSRARQRNSARTLASSSATAKAKKLDEYRKKQLEKKREKERQERLKQDYVRRGFDKVEARLGLVRDLKSNNGGVLALEATSVHGGGDKITLPSSLLSTLAERDLMQRSQERGQPLFFRLGIKREGYVFPASENMRRLMNEYGQESLSSGNNQIDSGEQQHEHDGNSDEELYSDDEDEKKEIEWKKAYIDELSHEYITYTYSTVVEFTQDEGCIGLPLSISTALLEPKDTQGINKDLSIENKLSVDPAAASILKNMPDVTNDDGDDESMASSVKPMETTTDQNDDDLENKTAGHPAYGLFPIPSPLIEVSLLSHLPLGTKCTLQPTRHAIENGFYNLKNIKLALEQSLIRTRGSLNVGDIVHCWFRGKKFDLNVQDVTPSEIGAVSCVNTDVVVDIAATAEESNDASQDMEVDESGKSNANGSGGQSSGFGGTVSGGYRLSDTNASTPTVTTPIPSVAGLKTQGKELQFDLPPEPPLEQKDNVIMIQIRGDAGKQCRRKFDATCTNMKHLFQFAMIEKIVDGDTSFRLVTRYPRRTFHFEDDGSTLLQAYQFASQEQFLIEKL